jgi:probable phosphoglycerate mutase
MRHGHTAWNRAGRIQGRTDEPLDEEARRHLSRLALPEHFRQAALLTSPLVRAVETARIVGRREPAVVPALAEMDWGDWEGRRGVDLLDDPNSGYRHIEEWGWDFQPPGGETPQHVWDRLKPWIASVEGPALVVTHIGVMRVLLARATGWNFEGTPPFKVKRDRLYLVDVARDGSLSCKTAPLRLAHADSP